MNTPRNSFRVNKLFSIKDKMPALRVSPEKKKYKKSSIPKALKEQVWLKHAGSVFEIKCPILWCDNRINCFNFHTGHNIPESKGGKTALENLIPICDRCNTSMGDRYTIDEWNELGKSGKAFVEPAPKMPIKPWWVCCTQ